MLNIIFYLDFDITDGIFIVAVWSGVNVAGTRLKDIHPHIGEKDDPEDWEQIHKDVVNGLVVV